MNSIYTQIIAQINQLCGQEVSYISGRNHVQVIDVDHPNKKIRAKRGTEDINISFDRIEVVANELAKGMLVDVNDALNSGGNDRAAIEAILANLPNVGYYNGNSRFNRSPQKKIAWFDNEINEIGKLKDASEIKPTPLISLIKIPNSLPKSFILLAGISGTGKTRFVREQAKAHRADLSNYCLIPVRPDWHEPSDLLGYVSRIATPRYVVTELLCFVIAAWKEAMLSATADAIQTKPATEMIPYWLCLDEMNLAPVEQYFADYLSVLESREWTADGYRCLPLLKADVFNKENTLAERLREDLALTHSDYNGLWEYFSKTGIPLPPNLIVAGTVNMDETTHGFSRKVIDRAFTIDFGAFFPNDFTHYFAPAIVNKTLSFPALSRVEQGDLGLVEADKDGKKSIEFLNAINLVLKDTPFELAFRALNELLISLVCFKPKTEAELQAVWDDFLMSKVLPRIDGDGHKLALNGDESLLTKLKKIAEDNLTDIWATQRPDLLRENTDKSPLTISCRSKQKLAWMHTRLSDNSFTSFWP